MFVNTVPARNGDRSLIRVGAQEPLDLVVSRARIASGPNLVYGNENLEELRTRYADICDALASGNVTIYECAEAVGYWKPKPKPARKTASAKAGQDG